MITSLRLIVVQILYLLMLYNVGCNSQKANNKLKDFVKDEYKKNRVKTVTQIKVGLDTSGNSMWSRVESIRLYNENGLVIISIVPTYVSRAPKSGGLSLRELEMIWSQETNIPTGQIDTTYFEYDDRDNLISIKSSLLVTYKYDSYNNWIEKCISGGLKENVCNYKKYEYDNNGRIIYSIDSAGPRSKNFSNIKNWKFEKVYYRYDENGNVLFDGRFKKYNNKGQLIEVKDSDSSSGVKESYLYDQNGKVKSETWTRGTYTSSTYFYYNDKGLLKQHKRLDPDNTLIELINYEYSYF